MKTQVELPGEDFEKQNHESKEAREVSLAVLRREPEIDTQIATAHAYPRSIARAIKSAVEMATHTKEIAESCIYSLERKDKDGKIKYIDGPSVRLAEIAASTWGNMRAEAKPVLEEARHVECEATAWDLESNLAIRVRKRRRITTKSGARFGDDLITLTINACNSICLRDAIFRVVPRSVIDQIYQAARAKAVGDPAVFEARREKMIASLAKAGVSVERLLARLEKKSVEEIDADDLATVLGFHNAIKAGDMTLDEAFPPVSTAPVASHEQQDADIPPPELKPEQPQPGPAPTYQEISRLAEEATIPATAFNAMCFKCGIVVNDKRTHTQPRLEKLAGMVMGYRPEEV